MQASPPLSRAPERQWQEAPAPASPGTHLSPLQRTSSSPVAILRSSSGLERCQHGSTGALALLALAEAEERAEQQEFRDLSTLGLRSTPAQPCAVGGDAKHRDAGRLRGGKETFQRCVWAVPSAAYAERSLCCH